MPGRRARRRWSREQKEAIVRRFHERRSSVCAFAREVDVAPSVLRSWVAELSGDGRRGAPVVARTEAPTLVPVRVTPSASAREEVAFEVVLSTGRSIRILEDRFDPEALARLVGVLEGC